MARQRLPSSGIEIELPITPMLDMTFQLLFFFVLSFRPSVGVEGKLMDTLLPATGDFKAQDTKTVDPTQESDTEVELPADLTVILKTVAEGPNIGSISQMAVQEPVGETPIESRDELRSHLEKLRTTLGNKEDIKIVADSRMKMAFVVEIMDLCRQAGFARVAFGPPIEKPANPGGQ